MQQGERKQKESNYWTTRSNEQAENKTHHQNTLMVVNLWVHGWNQF